MPPRQPNTPSTTIPKKPPKNKGLDHEWGVDLYGELLEIGGGKERMTKYFGVRCV
jgi:hypothetical protein